jgi:flagellar basal-body rod modification protein FlgD
MPESTVSGLASTLSSTSRGAASQANGFSSLSSEEFTKIIFAELGRQDPLSPNDTKALLEQISLIRGIESDTELTDSLRELVSGNTFSDAATFIGKSVTGFDENFSNVSGTVKSVSRGSDGGTILTLSTGERVSIDLVSSVQAP